MVKVRRNELSGSAGMRGMVECASTGSAQECLPAEGGNEWSLWNKNKEYSTGRGWMSVELNDGMFGWLYGWIKNLWMKWHWKSG